MSFNSALDILIFSLGILIIYAYGIITVQYKAFPYKVLRKIKCFILGNASKKNINSSTNISHCYKYLDRLSFIEEHGKKAEIVMLGDSLIARAEWRTLFPSKNIANHGIDGDTTAGLLDRIDLVHNSYPIKVLIMIGINDLLKEENIDSIYQNYQKIIKKLITYNIKVYIQSVLFVGNKKNYLNSNILTLNNMLEVFSHTNELISYVDLNKALANESNLYEKYTSDGIHLNGSGYKAWRDIISPYIM